jgi:hypothetical protein
MKIRKNLEAVFLIAAIITVPASFAAEKLHAVKNARIAAAATDPNMQVVVITGHRLSAAEKAALN